MKTLRMMILPRMQAKRPNLMMKNPQQSTMLLRRNPKLMNQQMILWQNNHFEGLLESQHLETF